MTPFLYFYVLKVEADDEPLKVNQVVCPETASEMVQGCWEQRERDQSRESGSLFTSSEEFLELVRQVCHAMLTVSFPNQ